MIQGDMTLAARGTKVSFDAIINYAELQSTNDASRVGKL